ncbi:MAG: MTH1187 family thiamine-binding protein [Thermoplasmatota archaeon]
MYMGFIIISPFDRGTSLSRYVKRAVEAISGTGIRYQVTPMGTVVEAEDLRSIFDAAEAGANAVAREGAKRISISVKVDMRLDKEITMESKMVSLKDQP